MSFLWLDSSFLVSAESSCIVWMDQSSLIHSPAEEHRVCFLILAAVKEAAVSIHVSLLVEMEVGCQHLGIELSGGDFCSVPCLP